MRRCRSWAKNKADYNAIPRKIKLRNKFDRDVSFWVLVTRHLVVRKIKRVQRQRYLIERLDDLEWETNWREYRYGDGIKPPFFRLFN